MRAIYEFMFDQEQQMIGSEYLGHLLGIRNNSFHVKSIKSRTMGHRIVRKSFKLKIVVLYFHCYNLNGDIDKRF